MVDEDFNKPKRMRSNIPKSILFVPRRNKGELITRLRLGQKKLFNIINNRIQFVERGGTRLNSVLVKKNPWEDHSCERVKCRICPGTEGASKCRKRSVLYQNKCVTCENNGKKVLYIEETGLSGFERSN